MSNAEGEDNNNNDNNDDVPNDEAEGSNERKGSRKIDTLALNRMFAWERFDKTGTRRNVNIRPPRRAKTDPPAGFLRSLFALNAVANSLAALDGQMKKFVKK